MSKKKLLAVTGLAAALSLLSPGCSRSEATGVQNSPKQTQQVNTRRNGNRENIAVSYIARDKDYVKSVNLLLSQYATVIPEVKKLYPKVGIEKALNEAFAICRTKGILKDNSRAYSFADLVIKNYGTEGFDDKDFESWSQKFSTAGREAELILREPEAIHRTFVPASFNREFLRRPIETSGKEDPYGWATCESLEEAFATKKMAQYWNNASKADFRN